MSLFIIKLDCDWLTVLCSLHVQFVKKVSDAESLIPNLDECRLDRCRTYNILDNSYNQAPPKAQLSALGDSLQVPFSYHKKSSCREISQPKKNEFAKGFAGIATIRR